MFLPCRIHGAALKIPAAAAPRNSQKALSRNRSFCNKEYIQGCISVLFSYKVGNVFRGPAGQVSDCRSRLSQMSSSDEQLIYLITDSGVCQQLFQIF